MFLLQRRGVGKGTGRDPITGQQGADERGTKTVAGAGVAGLFVAVLGLDGVGPLGDILGGEIEVFGAPGGVVEPFGEGIVFGLTVFGDGVLERGFFYF